jgi:hypothetical protein
VTDFTGIDGVKARCFSAGEMERMARSDVAVRRSESNIVSTPSAAMVAFQSSEL